MNFYADEQHVKITGRTLYRDHIRYLGYSATSVSFRFTGKKASVCLISDPENWPQESHAWIAVYINETEEPLKRIELTKREEDILLYESNQEETVTITIMKYSEPEYAVCGIKSITIDSEHLLPPPQKKQRQIQIIGDSITCGFGVEGSVEDMVHNTAIENPTKSYSVLTARALDADVEIIAWNGKGVFSSYIGDDRDTPDQSWLVPMLYEYTDAGCSKQYFREPQEKWEKWDSSRLTPDLVIVYLGTNDASYTREIPERNQEFSQAYQKLLLNIHTKHPQAKILCTVGTMDPRLNTTVEQAATEFAKNHPEVTITAFALPQQLDEDGLGTFWHPTAITHKKAAALIIEQARKLMDWD